MNDSKLWPWLDQAMSALNPRNRALAMAADAVVIFACWHVTYLFRLGFERWQPGRPWYDDYVSFGVVLLYLLFMALTGVPRGLWTSASTISSASPRPAPWRACSQRYWC